MLKQGFAVTFKIIKFLSFIFIPIAVILGIFALLCLSWFLVFRYYFKLELRPSGVVRLKKRSFWKQLFHDVPRRYILDLYEREPGFFQPKGIHMFCGEQGAGKTIACVELMLRLQKMYPAAKMITNFGVTTENDELTEWQQLLEYTNGHKGVIVGIDEIQNWFQSGRNQLPEGMLEVATQNRKNNRIVCCTAQVFTRVNKGLREQVTMLYEPHTFLGCFTIVIKRKPVLDNEGNVIDRKYRGMYSFVHTDELRSAYDTYKVIHTLAKEGFKDAPNTNVTNVYVAAPGRKR